MVPQLRDGKLIRSADVAASAAAFHGELSRMRVMAAPLTGRPDL